jgi:hypothetical protein
VRVLPPEPGVSEPARNLLDPWEEDFDLSLDDAVPDSEEPAPRP